MEMIFVILLHRPATSCPEKTDGIALWKILGILLSGLFFHQIEGFGEEEAPCVKSSSQLNLLGGRLRRLSENVLLRCFLKMLSERLRLIRSQIEELVAVRKWPRMMRAIPPPQPLGSGPSALAPVSMVALKASLSVSVTCDLSPFLQLD